MSNGNFSFFFPVALLRRGQRGPDRGHQPDRPPAPVASRPVTEAATRDLTITPDGAFSLAAAASFGFGPNTGRPKPDGNSMSLAFVADDLAASRRGVRHPGRRWRAPLPRLRRRGSGSGRRPGAPRALAGSVRIGVGRGRWPRPGDRPAPVGASRAPSGAVPFAVRGGGLVDPQPAQASHPGHRGAHAPVRGARPRLHAARRPISRPSRRPSSCFGSTRFPASSRSASSACTRVARAALEGRLDPARLLAMAPEDGDGRPAAAARHRSDVRRVDPAALDRRDRHPHPRRAAPARRTSATSTGSSIRRPPASSRPSPRPGGPSGPGPACSSASPATATAVDWGPQPRRRQVAACDDPPAGDGEGPRRGLGPLHPAGHRDAGLGQAWSRSTP